jgi:hypothetical protein
MDSDSRQHDAQKVISDLRDHLSRHDKPIAFFFGAGTSCSIRIPSSSDPDTLQALIPAVLALTEQCRDDIYKCGDKFKKAWDSLVTECNTRKLDPNIETILSQLRMMMNAIGAGDKLCGLNSSEISAMEESVRKTIAKAVMPNLSLIPPDFAHRKFARWLSKSSRKFPVEIFTVNYDVLFEHCLELERVPYFDGFVGSYQPFFHSDSLRRIESAPGANWVRLWKVHGSVNWRRIQFDDRKRIVRGEPDTDGAMIFPSMEKYDESRQQPYSAFTDRLGRFLDQDDALLITAGFSYGDEHINNIIFGALENRPRTHVYALQFNEVGDDTHLARYARQRRNVVLIGKESGFIGTRKASWLPADCPGFMKDVFSVIETGSKSKEPAVKSGQMKIGDFAAFCSFLESMSVE